VHTYLLTIAYDGTAYGGWQIQNNSVSIQATIQSALTTALRQPLTLIGASRTDAGVHAHAQRAHFQTAHPIDPHALRASLAGLLPLDIRVLEIDEVPHTFHARYDAAGKIYHYHCNLSPVADPFTPHALHLRTPLDLALIRQAIPYFIGTHCFTSFTNVGGAALTHIRTIKRLDLIEEGHLLRFEFEGDGFLYKMVRNIVGTLLEVGRGKLEPKAIGAIFSALDRKRAPAAAPAHALFLIEVHYPLEALKMECASR
jgi:tRNA pseudouridine38-40 synthase